MRLLNQIEAALVAAGWHEQASPDFQKFNRGEGTVLVGERTMLGIWVLYSDADSNLKKAGAMLVWALRNAGLKTQETRETKPVASDVGVIHIWVGARP